MKLHVKELTFHSANYQSTRTNPLCHFHVNSWQST